MTSRTIFLSKLLGLYCILGGLAMIVHKQEITQTIAALVHDAPLFFMVGVITLAAGLALVLGHNVWSGGALPVVVTIIGWLTLFKGVVIMFLTSAQSSGFFLGTMSYQQHEYFYTGFSVAIGLYLTIAGFLAKAD